MRLEILKLALVDFSKDPCKSWGPTYGNKDFLASTQARTPVTQADRNSARLLSGTYTPEQEAAFTRQCAQVEVFGGTASFPHYLPDSLEFSPMCASCKKRFASCKADASVCYECELKRLCPPLPWRDVSHHWFYNDRQWTMHVNGHVGGSSGDDLTFWWSNRNGSSNVGHQGLVICRDHEGKTTKLAFSSVATQAKQCFTIEWDLVGGTTKFFVVEGTSVNRGFTSDDEVDGFDPLVMDFILAMIPTWMLYVHRPRNPANGCFLG